MLLGCQVCCGGLCSFRKTNSATESKLGEARTCPAERVASVLSAAFACSVPAQSDTDAATTHPILVSFSHSPPNSIPDNPSFIHTNAIHMPFFFLILGFGVSVHMFLKRTGEDEENAARDFADRDDLVSRRELPQLQRA